MNTSQDPDPDLGEELRQTAGAEWAAEAAEDERLTELARKRRLDMSTVLKDISARGDRVSVQFGGHDFAGSVAHAGADYATIDGPGQRADVRLDTAVWSVVTSPLRAEAMPGGAETFRALLHEYAASEARIRLALPDAITLVGSIGVVAGDHLEVSDPDGRLLYVPYDLVLAVIRSTDFQ